MNAQELAKRVLEGEDPKQVLRVAGRERNLDIPRGYIKYECPSCGQVKLAPIGSVPSEMQWSDGHVCHNWHELDRNA